MSFTANLDDVVKENRNGLLGQHSSWKRVRLKEIASILNGFPFESARFKKDKGTPLIRIRDILLSDTDTFYDGDFDPAFLIQPGDLLIGMDGDFHCEIWSGKPALLNQRVCKITADESKFSRMFLRYILPGYLSAIHEWTPSVTVKHLSSRTIADIPIPCPTLEEQHRIVAKIEQQFSRLDVGTASLQRSQTNLRRYRAATLKAACEGTLVATEAELSKREGHPFESGTALLNRILKERRENWIGRGEYPNPPKVEAKDLPKLPPGWIWASAEQICSTVASGSTPTSTKMFAGTGEVPFLKVYNLTNNGSLDFSIKPTFVDRETHDGLLKRSKAFPGDILMNIVGPPLGKVSVVPDLFPEWNINQAIVVFRPSKLINSRLFSYWLLSNTVLGRLERTAKATAGQSNLQVTACRKLALPVPPIAEQARILSEVERRLSVIDELESLVSANLHKAARLRQAVLQKAFAGQLTVGDIAKPNLGTSTIINTVSAKDRHFARTLLSGEIVHQLHGEPTFGHVKHQKILHLCEYIAELEEIDGCYQRKVAGPFDNRLFHSNEGALKKQQWYEPYSRSGLGFAYRPMAKAGGHDKYLARFKPEKLEKIRKLIRQLRKDDTDQCEIFSTTYAAWNDLIIWGSEVTDDAILHEVWDRWDESKRRFPRERWLNAIRIIEKAGYQPTGFGKATAQPEQKQ